jgi:CRP-like cAMP-binding protein
VAFDLKQIILQFGQEVEYAVFPTTALISLLAVLEDDEPVEIATIGREGMDGLPAVLGVARSPHRVICQMGGEAQRLPMYLARRLLGSSPEFAGVVHRYSAFMLQNAGQTVACNALHTVEARAARWVLMTHDQAMRDEFPMTHEFLAIMLGVRRQTVTVVAGTLQNAGLIAYTRGRVSVRDRARLEDAACECYATIRAAYDETVG